MITRRSPPLVRAGLVALLVVACSEPSRDATGVAPEFHLGGHGNGPPTIIVDPSGRHGRPTTIQAGIDLVPAGGRVVVLPGTYAEAVVISKGLTLEGLRRDHDDDDATNEAAIVAPSGAAQAVNVTTTEPVFIRWLTVQGSPFGIRASNLAANLTVERTSVRDNTTVGITATWSTTPGGPTARLVVRHSLVEGVAVRPSSGISTQGDVNAVIEHNVVRGTATRCINVAFGSAVQVGASTTVNVFANDLDRCGTASGVNVTTANLQTGVRVANVVGNTIRNSEAEPIRNGVYFEGFAGRVEHNSIRGVVQPSANPAVEAIAGCCVVLPAGIFVGSLRGAAASTPVVRFNDIAGNAFAGLRIGPNQLTSLDARCNYWGAADGPAGVASGTGDAVLVETGGARPVLTPFASRPIADRGKRHHGHGGNHDFYPNHGHDDDDDDDRGGRESCRVEYSLWSEPVNLGAVVNSPVGDMNPGLSADELQLYIVSTRPGGLGGNDIWVSQRQCLTCPWGTPVNLGAPINSDAADGAPSISRDGRLLFFYSARPGGQGSSDIYVSRRDNPQDPFAWGPPVNLGPDANTAAQEQGVSYARDPRRRTATLHFNRGPAGNSRDLYSVTVNADGQTLGPAVPASELNHPAADDQKVAVRADGRELLLASDRPGSLGGFDLWVSTRGSVHGVWSTPSHLDGPLNTTGGDSQPVLTQDGQTMIYNSDRPGGSGGNDLWMSTRTRLSHHDR